MANRFIVELRVHEPPAEARARAASALDGPAGAVGLRLRPGVGGVNELVYRPPLGFPLMLSLWRRLRGERMRVAFDPGPAGGTSVAISGSVARRASALARDPDHWAGPLGGSPSDRRQSPPPAPPPRPKVARTASGAAASPGSDEAVIEVRGLRKVYDGREVVKGIDLQVRHGEVFAFLGPNGAGKTTTVEILEGYRRRNSGEVSVLGVDPAHADGAWRSRLGLVLQSCTMPAELTVSELLALYAGYYPKPRAVEETIGLVGLTGQHDSRTAHLSGGQLRRLDVALALIGDPELVFLDEPTTGFDPSARHQAWEVIANLRTLGKTIFLTTHYMDEAQSLADRVAVIRAGEIVAEGTPETLGGRDRAASDVSFALPVGVGFAALPDALRSLAELREGRVHIEARAPAQILHTLTEWALAHDHELHDLAVGRPSLEDVYLRLTGGERAPDRAEVGS